MQQVVDRVFTDKWTYQDAAIRLRISKGLVARIVKAYKTDTTLIEQMIEEERSLEQKIAVVAESASELVTKDQSIRKISVVQQHALRRSGVHFKPSFIASVMRRVADLTYSKVKRIPFRANMQ